MKVYGFDVTLPRVVNYIGDIIGFIGLLIGVLGAFEGLLPTEYAVAIGTVSLFLIKVSSWLSKLMSLLLLRKEVNGSYSVPVEPVDSSMEA